MSGGAARGVGLPSHDGGDNQREVGKPQPGGPEARSGTSISRLSLIIARYPTRAVIRDSADLEKQTRHGRALTSIPPSRLDSTPPVDPCWTPRPLSAMHALAVSPRESLPSRRPGCLARWEPDPVHAEIGVGLGLGERETSQGPLKGLIGRHGQFANMDACRQAKRKQQNVSGLCVAC